MFLIHTSSKSFNFFPEAGRRARGGPAGQGRGPAEARAGRGDAAGHEARQVRRAGLDRRPRAGAARGDEGGQGRADHRPVQEGLLRPRPPARALPHHARARVREPPARRRHPRRAARVRQGVVPRRPRVGPRHGFVIPRT